MFFKVLPQSEVSEINFYANGAISQGICTANVLYKLIAEYSDPSRVKAIVLACQLEKQVQNCLVTMGIQGSRKVWVEVRSIINPIPIIRLELHSNLMAA